MLPNGTAGELGGNGEPPAVGETAFPGDSYPPEEMANQVFDAIRGTASTSSLRSTRCWSGRRWALTAVPVARIPRFQPSARHARCRPPVGAMSEYTDIDVEIEDPVASHSLNRPEKLNAFTYQTLDETQGAINAAVADGAWWAS